MVNWGLKYKILGFRESPGEIFSGLEIERQNLLVPVAFQLLSIHQIHDTTVLSFFPGLHHQGNMDEKSG